MSEELIILPDSPKAAHKEIIEVWKSRTGQIFVGEDAERLARFSGATHNLCRECKKEGQEFVLRAPSVLCGPCKEKDNLIRWSASPDRPYSGEILYSEKADQYFFAFGDFVDYCHMDQMPPEMLRLYVCDPVYAGTIDESIYEDELPEDGELPVISARKEPLSYYPSKYVPRFEGEYKVAVDELNKIFGVH